MMRGRGLLAETPTQRKLYKPIHRLLTPRGSLSQDTASVDKFRAFPILDQGQTGSCNGHRTAMAVHVAFNAVGTPLPLFPSPDGIYRDAREFMARANPDGSLPPLTDSGAATSDVLWALATCGVRQIQCPAADGRNSDVNVATVNDPPLLTDLADEAETVVDIDECYEILTGQSDTLPMVQAALKAGYPVMLDVLVDAAFEQWGEGWTAARSPVDDCDVANSGAHAILCTELIPSGDNCILRGPNSWGVGWGNAGYWEATDAWFAKAVFSIKVFKVPARTS